MKRKILIVDDDAATLIALSAALSTRFGGDIAIDVASSAESALALMQKVTYDVVISDILMPGTDGIELLKKARQRWADLVMVLVTAGDLNVETDAMANGAFAFVAKPLDIDAFVSTIKSALERAEAL